MSQKTEIAKYDVFEVSLQGRTEGNPFTDYTIEGVFTGEKEEGGKWYSRKYGYLDIPLMVRPNSVIAIGACEEGPEYDYADNVTFRVYEVTSQASAVVYDMEGRRTAELTVRRDGNRLDITAKTEKPFTVELYNVAVEAVEGAQLRQEGSCAVLEQCGSRMTCILK